DAQAEGLAQGFGLQADRLQRRQEAALGLDVRVAHAVADHGADPGEFAAARHGFVPSRRLAQKRPGRINQLRAGEDPRARGSRIRSGRARRQASDGLRTCSAAVQTPPLQAGMNLGTTSALKAPMTDFARTLSTSRAARL